MTEHELWVTRLFNDHLAGLGNAILNLAGQHAHDPARPWANFITMQIVVTLIIVAVVLMVRASLSMDRPGKLQQIFELIHGFLHGQAEEVVGHDGHKHLNVFGTLFIFILFSNLLGVIPTFEAPTMFPYVPAGCAILVFLYYNLQGFVANGPRYVLHFTGTNWWMMPLMLPIEIISHLARPLSLTIRLYANMFAGEQVTLAFLGLTYFAIPAIFMGLHVFVAFLQAYVFALLTMIYVGSAVSHEH